MVDRCAAAGVQFRDDPHSHSSRRIVLTAGAFGAVQWPSLLNSWTFATVCVSGLQAIVQFRFFLHVRLKGSGRDDLLLLMFSSIIIVLMVSGTLVLMANLRGRMM